MKKQKTEIITFKVDEAISAALKDVPNKSEFIRSAVTAALASTCPLCQGAGYLTPSQKEHWDRFSRNHTVQECQECHERHIICGKGLKAEPARIK